MRLVHPHPDVYIIHPLTPRTPKPLLTKVKLLQLLFSTSNFTQAGISSANFRGVEVSTTFQLEPGQQFIPGSLIVLLEFGGFEAGVCWE